RKLRAREHQLRAVRRHDQGHRSGGARGGRPRLHHQAARGVRYRGPGAGRQPLDRAAPVGVVRAGAAGRPQDPDPRRGDEQHRHPDRAADPARAQAAAGGADLVRDRPPPLDDPRGGQGGGDEPRQDRRDRHPRRADREAGDVLQPVHDAVARRRHRRRL
ncbi:MAG: Heterodimeric efflux ABC transporter, permease/ATP-binding subunit 2, partial [uncultured Thermomicrobiales bacterium]